MTWSVLVPEALVGAAALAAWMLPPSLRGRSRLELPAAAALVLLVAWGVELAAGAAVGSFFGGGFVQDRLALFAKSFLLLAALVAVAIGDWEIADRPHREISLLLWACFGGLVVASSGDLAGVWCGYLLALVAVVVALGGFAFRTGEAGPATSTAFRLAVAGGGALLVTAAGFAFLYAAAGQSDLAGIAQHLPEGVTSGPLAVASIVSIGGLAAGLVALGLLLRGSASWPGDASVAAGPIAGLAAGAAAVALLKILAAVGGSAAGWTPVLAALATVMVLVGGAGALGARSIRGLVGWLVVAQAGWITAGFAVHARFAAAGALFLLGIFLVAACGLSALLGEDLLDRLPALSGHARRVPSAGAAIAIALLSLAGAPPLGGWFGEFAVAAGLAQAGYYWLLLAAVGGGLLALGAVARVLVMVFLLDPAEGTVTLLNPLRSAGSLALIAVLIGFALFANPLHGLAVQGAEALGLP